MPGSPILLLRPSAQQSPLPGYLEFGVRVVVLGLGPEVMSLGSYKYP